MHDYGVHGIYTIAVTGTATSYNSDANGGPIPERQKLVSVDHWGQLGFTDMSCAFRLCTNLVSVPNTSQGLEAVIDMSDMFGGASLFNAEIGHWDTSGVLDMERMFAGASSFNGDIGVWDTSAVTEMAGMFRNASAFNQDISAWDTSSLTTMHNMFYGAWSFNQPIGTWIPRTLPTWAGCFMRHCVRSGYQPLEYLECHRHELDVPRC